MPKYYCAGAKFEPKPFCDYSSEVRWLGPCPGCGTFSDILKTPPKKSAELTALTALTKPPPRISSGISEFDRVLGGGLVPGSTQVLTGPPGAGKTTLLMQACVAVARAAPAGKNPASIYASGEQGKAGLGYLAQRLGADERVAALENECDVYKIVDIAYERRPVLLVIDSINVMIAEEAGGDVNSARQIEAAANYITSFANDTQVCVVVVAHVNKQGLLSGPKVFEHLVDGVLYFEPYEPEEDDYDGEGRLRPGCDLLRVISTSLKNRYCPPGVKAVLELTDEGLRTPERPRLSPRPRGGGGRRGGGGARLTLV